jgi:transposase InsO family protein
VTQASLRCFILWRPSPASRSSSTRRSGRSTLTPARSDTPSHQQRTSHDQLASVDEQPRSQIRSINALSESFFASLKGELIDLQAWPTRAMARRAIVEYIAWYNRTRLHSTLGYKTPAVEEQDKIRKVASTEA